MNHLVVIGYMSIKRAYLNLTREQAIDRYMKEEFIGEDHGRAEIEALTTEFDFVDVFGVYDAYEC